jgi:hypothetical protein
MKLFLLGLLLAGSTATYADAQPEQDARSIDFPDPEGYVTLVADLHTHTVFSDGDVWPTIRIEEATKDGIDVISFTEHLEYQPHIEDIPHPDRNRSFELGQLAVSNSDLMVIRGAEITRQINDDLKAPGHINAVFIQDANKLYRYDASRKEEALAQFRPQATIHSPAEEYNAIARLWPAEQAMQEANAQSAFVFWNHPAWFAQRPDGIATLENIHKQFIADGLLHGIEVVNMHWFSEAALQIALDNNLTILGTSDVHQLIDWDYEPHHGGHRPVTLILAETNTEASVKEALFARRTVVWFNDLLIGEERNVAPLLKVSLTIASASYTPDTTILEVTFRNVSDATFQLKNLSSYTFAEDDDYLVIPQHSETMIPVNVIDRLATVELEFEVLNAIIAPKTHPRLKLQSNIH